MEEDGRDSTEKPRARVNTWMERQKHTSCKKGEKREREREAYHLAEVPLECCMHSQFSGQLLTLNSTVHISSHLVWAKWILLLFVFCCCFCSVKFARGNFAALNDSKWEKLETL